MQRINLQMGFLHVYVLYTKDKTMHPFITLIEHDKVSFQNVCNISNFLSGLKRVIFVIVNINDTFYSKVMNYVFE